MNSQNEKAIILFSGEPNSINLAYWAKEQG